MNSAIATRARLPLLLLIGASLSAVSSRAPAAPYRTRDPSLKVVVIDRDERESFLSMTLDGAGRLFVGCREALLVYEPRPGGLYEARRELYRFPRDTWIYDVAVRGQDLYVLTTGALYLFPEARVRRT